MVSYFASLLTQYIDIINNDNDTTHNNNNNNNNIPIFELHSKKSQGYRTRTSDTFRKTKNGILFTSDVSARGIDYPAVTHVLQFGLPESREQYIHRLGRTARAGNEGKGWLVLNDFESFFVEDDLDDLRIPREEQLYALIENLHHKSNKKNNSNDTTKEQRQNNDLHQNTILQILNTRYNEEEAQNVYRSFLGYYTSQIKRLPKTTKEEELVSFAYQLAIGMGLKHKDVLPPPLTKRMVTKMGLKGVKGLRIVDSLLSSSSPSSFSTREEEGRMEYSKQQEEIIDNGTIQHQQNTKIRTGETPRRRQRK